MIGPLTILLTGESGAGKTVTASRLVAARPRSIVGVLSVSEWEEGVRRAIVAHLLPDGAAVALARLARPVVSSRTIPPPLDDGLDDAGRPVVRLGPWNFSADGIERVNRHLRRLADAQRPATPMHGIVIDEIGPLELVHGGGFLTGLHAVVSARLPSIIVVRPSLVESIRTLLAAAGGADTPPRVAVAEITHPTESPRVCDAILAMLDDSDAGTV